jgi:HEPN domain-containing protein
MKDPLKNIVRYSETWVVDSGDPSYGSVLKGMAVTPNGHYVRYNDILPMLKELQDKLDKEYERGYEAGLDAAYVSAQYRKD